jgi:1-acyl-sn-glycerol-3-phosphate acyltransferase
MIKLRYAWLKRVINTGLFFYFKKIEVNGKEGIPKEGAIIFLSNHQNAMIDPMIIGATNGRTIHFLTRASAFKNKLANKILRAFQLIPVYRFRDGFSALKGNKQTFSECTSILKNEEGLLIFPEGNHNLERRVRPLSKGVAKIIQETLEVYPKLPIYIVPVGLNYQSATKYASSVMVQYGEPFLANSYFDDSEFSMASNKLLTKVYEALTKLTTHIGTTDYVNTVATLNVNHANFLKPTKINAWLQDNNTKLPIRKKDSSILKTVLYAMVMVNSVLPFGVWKLWVEPKVKEAEFLATFRFAVGMVLMPIGYCLQMLTVAYFYNLPIAIGYLILSLLVLLGYVKK